MTVLRVSIGLAALGGLLVFGAAAASAQDTQLFAVLSGGNEVSPTGQAAAGDLDGAGASTVNVVAADQLCFAILVNHLDPPTIGAPPARTTPSRSPCFPARWPRPPRANPGPTHEISAINAQGVVSGERAGRQPRRMHSGLAN